MSPQMAGVSAAGTGTPGISGATSLGGIQQLRLAMSFEPSSLLEIVVITLHFEKPATMK